MDQLGALRRRPGGEVVPFDERRAQPRAAASSAVPTPVMPPPITSTSKRSRRRRRASSSGRTRRRPWSASVRMSLPAAATAPLGGARSSGGRSATPGVAGVPDGPPLAGAVFMAVNQQLLQIGWPTRSLALVRSPSRAHRGLPGPGAEDHASAPAASSASCTATTATPRAEAVYAAAVEPRCPPSRCAPSTRRSTTSRRWARSTARPRHRLGPLRPQRRGPPPPRVRPLRPDRATSTVEGASALVPDGEPSGFTITGTEIVFRGLCADAARRPQRPAQHPPTAPNHQGGHRHA